MSTNRSNIPAKRKTIEPAILAAIIAGITTIIVALISYYGSLTTVTLAIEATQTAEAANSTGTPTPPRTPTLTIVTAVSTGTLSLKDQVAVLANEVSSLQTQVAVDKNLKQELDSVTNRLSEMENVIEKNPSEAMAYVVLRKDLDEAQSNIKDLQLRLTSSWTQNLPLYGLVVTVGFTLLSIVRSDRKQNQEQNRENSSNKERRENQKYE
ncbi:MAG: hypothetical protein H7Y59_11235 [Anaerolineales bacterium]|nr:hypothetical protein [Anaerolineales bacterium]